MLNRTLFHRILKFLPFILFSLLVGCDLAGGQQDDKNTPPEAVFVISPTVGDSTTSFVLRGNGSTDAEDINQFLEFRWDLNNDSIWDTQFSDYPYLIQHFPVPGSYLIRMEVRDRFGLSDVDTVTVFTYGMNNDTSRFEDPRDGQFYRTVKIGGTWWMAENLNFGVMIRDTQLARNNGIFEKYSYRNDPSIKGISGGYLTYYDWDEVINYDTLRPGGLCPPGWEMPKQTDWYALLNPFNIRGLRTYFGEGGYSRLNLSPIGIHELTKHWETIDESPCSSYWMYLSGSFQKDFYRRHYGPCPVIFSSSIIRTFVSENNTLIRFVNDSIMKNGGALPVRCIKTKE